MEWVETTARTIEDATEIALDQLGVDESDIELEVVQEPKPGVFGIGRTDARIRARVRPQTPRAKEQDHQRRKTHRSETRREVKRSPLHDQNAHEDPAVSSKDQRRPHEAPKRNRSQQRRSNHGDSQQEGTNNMTYEERGTVVPLDEQGVCAKNFLVGLLETLEVRAPILVNIDEEEELIKIAIDGEQLGHLIGPRGATLQALQELTRTVVQRQTDARNGKIIVDIGEYRAKRREALTRFAQKMAEEVRESQTKRVLEPMNPADRKVVHDAINEIDGVSTHSEGESVRRRVVIQPSAMQSE